MASGIVTEEPYKAPPYAEARTGGRALYVGVRFDVLLHPDDGILTIEQLRTEHLADFPWHIQGSGITIPPPAAAELEAVWSAFLTARGHKPLSLADEVPSPGRFFEGVTRQISVNSYERSPYARQQCIAHYGCRCAVCGFDFEPAYGELGTGFIHVHHLKPWSEIREEYEIDPIADLRPICPNCHAMIHRGVEMMSIEDLRERLQSNVQSP